MTQELAPAFDDVGPASWDARPNALLPGMRPVQALHIDPGTVIDAARADPFCCWEAA